MGSHSDGVSIAAAIHTEEFGGTISYTPPGGVAGNVNAILYPVRHERRTTSIGTIDVQVRDVLVEIVILAEPVINGVFTIDSETWSIERMEREPSGRWRLSLLKIVIGEITRNQYRRGVR